MPSKPFLVTGLPRSRTAWFSVACTSERSICYHEPTRTTSSFNDLKALWESDAHDYVGMSDHALGFQLSRIIAEIEPRILMVERDMVEVWRSLGRYLPDEMQPTSGTADAFLNDLQNHLSQWKKHRLVKRVAFDKLNDFSVMIDCLEWLMPHGNFEHVRDLMDMNIQVKLEATKRHLAEPHSHWYRA